MAEDYKKLAEEHMDSYRQRAEEMVEGYKEEIKFKEETPRTNQFTQRRISGACSCKARRETAFLARLSERAELLMKEEFTSK